MQPSDPIGAHFPRLKQEQKEALTRLGIEDVRSLLYHLPTRYECVDEIKRVRDVTYGENVILFGRIEGLKTRKTWKGRRPVAQARLIDDTGAIAITWFNQPYIATQIPEGAFAKLVGKTSGKDGKLYLANPEFELMAGLPADLETTLFADKAHRPAYLPVYRETRGITSRWFYHATQKLFAQGGHEILSDPIPREIRERYNLPTLATALLWAHTPQRAHDYQSARKRFAFEEVFTIQLAKQKQRARTARQESVQIDLNTEALSAFIDTFPFTPTDAQHRAIADIIEDFKKPHPMSRLLEGDVGSGKTAVAAATVYAVAMTEPHKSTDGSSYGNLQTAYMVPTEILARQHFESFIEYFGHLPINIGLITSSGCRKFPSKTDPKSSTRISKPQLLGWIANGEIPIVIGTHALIQKSVQFENLAYVIIDEQHRFGTVQRRELTRKDARMPHLLSMSATPIPRTLALTIYGDLDLSILDELPAGRKLVQTSVIPTDARKDVYERIRTELAAGRQAYVICPRIDEPDPKKKLAVQAKSVTEEAKRLANDIFPEFSIGLVHGKLSPKEKELAMHNFTNHETDILVATSVVEVGVNIPNATIIVIEGAERFGLAQLHQLRGRVQRSEHQPYCYLFTDARSDITLKRLRALEKSKDGFELAEQDLKLRGAGELVGGKQWGVSDIGMEALQNIKMVEAARTEAQQLITADPELADHPELAAAISHRDQILHFE